MYKTTARVEVQKAAGYLLLKEIERRMEAGTEFRNVIIPESDFLAFNTKLIDLFKGRNPLYRIVSLQESLEKDGFIDYTRYFYFDEGKNLRIQPRKPNEPEILNDVFFEEFKDFCLSCSVDFLLSAQEAYISIYQRL